MSIVDLDKSPDYPVNFVCNLPKTIKVNERQPSNFSKTFGDGKLEVAKTLLNDALKTEDDPDIISDIEARLKML